MSYATKHIIRKITAIFLFFSSYFVDLLNYDRLSRKPLLFRSFTGLELSEFDSICKQVESKYPDYETKRLSKRKDRTRSIGAGRHFKHSIKDRFLTCFLYTINCT